MPMFQHDGLNLNYLTEGDEDGQVILLIHGFASSMVFNWINPGWVNTLAQAGFRIIALDNRGHGSSDKPHEIEAYEPQKMAGDALALLDHLSIKQADVFGYSMGARIAAFLALAAPERIGSIVFGGLGIGMVEGVGDWDPIAEALLAPSIDVVEHPQGQTFRAFADQTGSDRLALAACIQSSRTLLTKDQMASISAPTLIGVGTKDDIAGNAQQLADLMPNARAFEIERRDHMLAVGDASFKREVTAFLRDQH